MLGGEIEIDDKYAGGHIRPRNKAEDRIDRRKAKYQNHKRLCALALRERRLGRPGQIFTRIIYDEDSDAAWSAARITSCGTLGLDANPFASSGGEVFIICCPTATTCSKARRCTSLCYCKRGELRPKQGGRSWTVNLLPFLPPMSLATPR
jgi:ISXO2 transposase-like protein